MFNRRHFLHAAAGSGAVLGLSALTPAWAKSAGHGNHGLKALRGSNFDLSIGKFPVRIEGRAAEAIGVNDGVPAPLLRFREGDEITLNVTNNLMVDSSIHWHGLLVPFHMDGVPGVSFPGIKPGETFKYKFSVPQNGTYWYHSHSGLQEQLGHYGPIIIDPKGKDPVEYDREYIMVLSDWSFEDPHRIFSKLKKSSDTYNYAQMTFSEKMKFAGRGMWDQMRMSPRDIADVTGATYTYLINGQSTAENWNGLFKVGERVRLRIINASAMTFFNVRIPGLPMTIVQSDGLHVKPLEIDEFQMGVAETYDVIIEPKEDRAYAFVAESIDRSGQAVATLAPEPGMRAAAPALREVPTLKMIDMGMSGHDMGSQGMELMDADMDHNMHDMTAPAAPQDAPLVKRGPGVANIAMNPVNRLHEPGIGLDNVPHRTLRYADLRSLEPNPDTRPLDREMKLHLTSNMERYMWSFNGVKFAHIKEPIKFYEGERVRLTMINDTMMPHPIHLHGMYFDLVNGGGNHKPRKHTVTVKPGEILSVDVTADAVGDWAFHCHLLYHMHAGMMQVVSVLPSHEMKHHEPKPVKMDHSKMDHGEMHK
jgi:CopA family copper-resistance protein